MTAVRVTFSPGNPLEVSMTRNAYSIAELAHRNNVSRSTIYREHGRGRLRFIRIGARTLITAEEEARWLRGAETVACAIRQPEPPMDRKPSLDTAVKRRRI